ncbi:hypothetical protein CLCR_01360 [Cladophialophora carrionii]|uniref:Uncharacterized protein n=1 Tax=Cladophialophora carrionii TaxID=86049 RepID=A0A1C1CCQ2_9EURO|nr:hypothetical protein CLCR_01360 [Cladophialophora carrionii]
MANPICQPKPQPFAVFRKPVRSEQKLQLEAGVVRPSQRFFKWTTSTSELPEPLSSTPRVAPTPVIPGALPSMTGDANQKQNDC